MNNHSKRCVFTRGKIAEAVSGYVVSKSKRAIIATMSAMKDIYENSKPSEDNEDEYVYNIGETELPITISKEIYDECKSVFLQEDTESLFSQTETLIEDKNADVQTIQEKTSELANKINGFLNKCKDEDELNLYLKKHNAEELRLSKEFKKFKQIPADMREQLISTITSVFITFIDNDMKRPENKGKSRLEVINQSKRLMPYRILNSIMHNLDTMLAGKTEIAKKMREQGWGKANAEEMYKLLADLLVEKDGEGYKKNGNFYCPSSVFNAAYNMSIFEIGEAELIKLGKNFDFVADISDEDYDTLNQDAINDPEEETREHWQIKADTESSFKSATKEVRRVLFRVHYDYYNIFGSFLRPNPRDVHSHLLAMREEFSCQDSEDFLEALLRKHHFEDGLKTKQIFDILVKEPRLATMFFSTYKKNTLSYVYADTKWSNGVMVFFRNKTGKSKNIIVSTYTEQAFLIDNKESCLFNSEGQFIKERIMAFFNKLDMLSVRSQSAMGEDSYLFGSAVSINYDFENGYTFTENGTENRKLERRKDFVAFLNSSLNLHFTNAEIDRTATDDAQWKNFSTYMHSVLTNLKETLVTEKDNGSVTVTGGKVKKFLTKNTNAYANILKDKASIKKRITKESVCRYNESTYQTFVIPSFITDFLDKLQYIIKSNIEYEEDGSYDSDIAKGIPREQAIDGYATIRNIRQAIIENFFIYKQDDNIVVNTLFLDKSKVGNITNNNYIEELLKLDSSEISNPILRMMWDITVKDIVDQFSPINLFLTDLTRALGTKQKPFEDFVEKDNYLFSMNEYFNALATSNNQCVAVPLFVTGDSNSGRYFTVETVNKTAEDRNDGIKSNPVKARLREVFNTEIERMRLFRDICELYGITSDRDPIVKNAMRFSFLRVFNEGEYALSEDELNALIKEDTSNPKYASALAKVDNGINKYLEDGFNHFIDELKRTKIVSYNKETKEYFISPKILSVLRAEDLNKELTPDLQNTIVTQNDLENFWIDTKLSLINQMQLFTTDTGFYDGTLDLLKRYKEMIASGEVLDLTAKNPYSEEHELIDDQGGYQNCLYFDDIAVPASEGFTDAVMGNEELSKKRDDRGRPYDVAYSSNTLTDGQGYRSFSSYRKLMIMRGSWTQEMEDVYNIIMKARSEHRPLSIEEHKQIEQLNVVFQPLKPFYFGFEDIMLDGKLLKVPVQHKYSEFPLIPELLPADSKLGMLGRFMEANHIDLACSTKCVKVGGFNTVDISQCKTQADFDSIPLTGPNGISKIHKLQLSGWRQQNNVPEHMGGSRARGTQFIKHLLGCFSGKSRAYKFLSKFVEKGFLLSKQKDLEIRLFFNNDGSVSEHALMQMAIALTSSGFIKSTKKFIDTYRDPKKFTELLSNLRCNDSRAAKDGLLANDIDVNGDINLSPAEGITAFDNMASLLSQVRKQIVQQLIKGGSAVQVGGWGYEDKLKCHIVTDKEGNQNISKVDCAIAFDMSYTVIKDGKPVEVQLSYYDYIDPETGIPLKEDGSKYTFEEYEEMYNKAMTEGTPLKTKLNKEFPGSHELISYRIPTEKDYSIQNLSAKFFLPKTTGGVIILPAQYTKIAGFDFDIDKLYFIKREYKRAKRNLPDNKVMWRRIWARNPKLLKALQAHKKDVLEGLGSLMADATNAKNAETTTLGDTLGDVLESLLQQLREEDEQQAAGEENDDLTNNEQDNTKDYSASVDEAERKLSEEEIKEIEKEWKEANNKRLNQFWDELTDDEKETLFRGIPEEATTSAEAFFKYWIDRLYPERWVEYDENKSVLENSQVGINNLLFELYQARLEDYDTFEERYTIGGFNNLKQSKPLMMFLNYGTKEEFEDLLNGRITIEQLKEKYKGFEPDYDPVDITTIAHYQTYNSLYDKLIGVAANQNINQRITALLNICRLKQPIRFGSLLNSKDSAAGTDIKKRIVNGQDTELLTTEFLASAVDAVKDALLEFYGMDENNFAMACLMAKIGASPEDIGLLLNQPVIKRAMEIMKEDGGSSSFSYAIEKAYKEFSDNKPPKFYNLDEDADGRAEREKLLDGKTLLWSIAKGKTQDMSSLQKDARFLEALGAVVSLMKEIQAASTELTEEISCSKFTSVKSIASKFGEVQATVHKVERVSGKFGDENSMFKIAIVTTDIEQFTSRQIIDTTLSIIANPQKALERISHSPFGMEQAVYSALKDVIDYVISEYFPYESKVFRTASESLASLTSRGYISGEIQEQFNKDFLCSLLEKVCGRNTLPGQIEGLTDSLTDTELTRISLPIGVDENGELITKDIELPEGKGITRREFYLLFFPTFFQQVLTAWSKEERETLGRANVLLDCIQVNHYKNGTVTLSFNEIGNLEKRDKDFLIGSWEQMYTGDNPMLRELAIMLFQYSYYTSGFDFSPLSFMYLAPVAMKTDLFDGDYKKFFANIEKMKADTMNSAIYENANTKNVIGNLKEIIKTFIVNHANTLGYYAFVLKLKNTDVKTTSDRDNLIEFDAIRGTITVKVPNSLEDSKSDQVTTVKKLFTKLAKEDKKDNFAYKFIPCIILDGKIYICDNDSPTTAFTTKDEEKYYTTMVYKEVPIAYTTPSYNEHNYGNLDSREKVQDSDVSNEIVNSMEEIEASEEGIRITPEREDSNQFGGEAVQTPAFREELSKFATPLQRLLASASTGGFTRQAYEKIGNVYEELLLFGKQNELTSPEAFLKSINDTLELLTAYREDASLSEKQLENLNELFNEMREKYRQTTLFSVRTGVLSLAKYTVNSIIEQLTKNVDKDKRANFSKTDFAKLISKMRDTWDDRLAMAIDNNQQSGNNSHLEAIKGYLQQMIEAMNNVAQYIEDNSYSITDFYSQAYSQQISRSYVSADIDTDAILEEIRNIQSKDYIQVFTKLSNLNIPVTVWSNISYTVKSNIVHAILNKNFGTGSEEQLEQHLATLKAELENALVINNTINDVGIEIQKQAIQIRQITKNLSNILNSINENADNIRMLYDKSTDPGNTCD